MNIIKKLLKITRICSIIITEIKRKERCIWKFFANLTSTICFAVRKPTRAPRFTIFTGTKIMKSANRLTILAHSELTARL